MGPRRTIAEDDVYAFLRPASERAAGACRRWLDSGINQEFLVGRHFRASASGFHTVKGTWEKEGLQTTRTTEEGSEASAGGSSAAGTADQTGQTAVSCSSGEVVADPRLANPGRQRD